MKTTTFYCDYCNKEKSHISDFTAGYATDKDNKKICFDCCAIEDKKYMIENGNSKALPLYLFPAKNPPKKLCPGETYGIWEVSNWPGTLCFKCGAPKKSRHNIAGSRYDVWFDGPDGFIWHGVNYGKNNQIVHCKRTKEKSK